MANSEPSPLAMVEPEPTPSPALRSASRLTLPSIPKLSVITSYFSSSNPPAPDTANSDHITSPPGPPLPSPTDSAGPNFAFRDRSTQGSMSDAASETRSKKRVQRPKTSFSICHPPPKKTNSKRQVHIRAKPLLQLQKLETHTRPRPAFEVLPSSIFSPRLTKAVNKLFGAKHCLCPTDLALVKAEEYRAYEATGEDESPDVIAIICGLSRKDASTPGGPVRMIFANGIEWEGVRLSNGGYECTTSDAHGLKQTGRWVYKKKGKAGDSLPRLDEAPTDKKFKFSTISSTSRRHPIIASLSNTTLDVYDSYTQPSSVSTPSGDATETNEAVTTTHSLRDLITASAVWVALCEHRSGNIRGLDTRSPSFKSVSSSRSFTSSPPTSPTKRAKDDNSIGPAPRGAFFKQTFQRAPSLLRRQITGVRSASTPTELTNVSGPAAVETGEELRVDGAAAPIKTRARADTTSTVLINENAAQWRLDFEADMPHCEENDEVEADSPRRLSGGGGMRARPSLGHTPGDTSRSTSGSDGMLERDKTLARQAMHRARKRRLMSRLLCGLV